MTYSDIKKKQKKYRFQKQFQKLLVNFTNNYKDK